MRKNLFIKVSGDMCTNKLFIEYLRKATANYFTVVCVGGGSQINEALSTAGVKKTPHGPLGRELKTFELKQLARDVLEINQANLQNLLADLKINATVIIPVMDVGSVLCHVNGDQLVRTVYLGYNKIVIVTTKKRVRDKREDFADLPKVSVVGFT